MRNWAAVFFFLLSLYIINQLVLSPRSVSDYNAVSLLGVLLLIVAALWFIAYLRASPKLQNAFSEGLSKLAKDGGMASRRMLGYAAIGAIIGVAIGYALYALGRAPYTVPINVWLLNETTGSPLDAMIWAALGAAIGTIAAYLRGVASH